MCLGTEALPTQLQEFVPGDDDSRSDRVISFTEIKAQCADTELVPSDDLYETVVFWFSLARCARKHLICDVAYAASSIALRLIQETRPDASKDAGCVVIADDVEHARFVAELNFILGETIVKLLMDDDIKLGNCPNHSGERYTIWVKEQTAIASAAFVKAAEVGASLKESWLVINATVYIWNYGIHLFESNRHHELGESMKVLHRLLSAVIRFSGNMCDVRAIILDARVVNVIIIGQLQNLTSSKDTGKPSVEESLTLCDEALICLGSHSYVDSNRLLETRVKLLAVSERPLIYETADNALSAMFKVESLNAYQKNADFSMPAQNNHENLRTTDVVESLISCIDGHGRSCVKERTGMCRNLGRMHAMQLLIRVAIMCVHACDWKAAKECAGHVFGLKKPSEPLRTGNRVLGKPTEEYMIFHAAHCILGLVAAAGIENSTLESEQGSVRKEALRHFIAASDCGASVGNSLMVAFAAQHIWNISLPFASSTLTLPLVISPLKKVLWTLASVEGKSSVEKSSTTVDRSNMYRLLFEAYAAKSMWTEGLAAVDHAFSSLPRKIRGFLSIYRIIFKSKLGLSISRDVTSITTGSPAERAKIWQTLAQVDSTPLGQLKAMLKAVLCVKSQPGMELEAAEYTIDLAKWIFNRGGQTGHVDAVDLLQVAIDLVLSLRLSQNRDSCDANRSIIHPLNASECELLARAHTMIAEHSECNADRKRHCMLAYHHYVELWTVTLECGNAELAAKATRSEDETTKLTKNKNSKDKNGFPEVQYKECITLPQSTVDWCTFKLDESFIDAVYAHTATTIFSLKKPEQAAHYASQLVSVLERNGMHHLCMAPLLMSYHIFSRRGPCPNHASAYLHGQHLSELCNLMNLPAAATIYAKVAGYAISTEDVTQIRKNSYQSMQQFDIIELGSEVQTTYMADQVCDLPPLVPVLKPWVCTDLANFLLDNNRIPEARKLLFEIEMAAKAVGDTGLLSQVHVCGARLENLRDRPTEAVSILKRLPLHTASLSFWMDTALVLDSSLCLEAQQAQARGVDSDVGVRVKATLEDAAALFGSLAINRSPGRSSYYRCQAILLARLAQITLQFGIPTQITNSINNAITIFKESHDILLAQEDFYLAAESSLSFLAKLTEHLPDKSDELYRSSMLEIRTILSASEVQLQTIIENLPLSPFSNPADVSVSIPAKELLTNVLLLRARLEGLAFNEACKEKRVRLKEAMTPPTIERVIADFIQNEDEEAESSAWDDFLKKSGEAASSRLTSVQSFASNSLAAQAAANAMLGRVLRLSSERERTSAFLEASRGLWSTTNAESLATPDDGMSVADEKKVQLADDLLQQSLNALVCAVDVGLTCGDRSTVASAALDIVDAIGNTAADTSARYLAIYQSCVASDDLWKLFEKAIGPSDQFGEKASIILSTAENKKGSLQNVTVDSIAAKQCSISPAALTLVDAIPPAFRFLILQHSTDGHDLYVAVLAPGMPDYNRIERVSVDVEAMLRLKKCMVEYESMINSILSEMDHSDNDMKIADAIDVALSDVIEKLQNYLANALACVEQAFSDPNLDPFHLVILADTSLMHFPLEGLDSFKKNCFETVSRDFSLQFFCHRMSVSPEDKPPAIDPKAKVGKSGKPTSAKGGKSGKNPATPSIDVVHINPSEVRYVIDPFGDYVPPHGTRKLTKLLEDTVPNDFQKWKGVAGTADTVPCQADIQRALHDSLGVVFYGPSNLLSQMSAPAIACLDLQKCRLAILADKIVCQDGLKNAVARDAKKTAVQLEMQGFVQTAALLSLRGIKCVAVNQWSTTADDNATRLGAIVGGETVGVAIRSFSLLEDDRGDVELTDSKNQRGSSAKSSANAVKKPSSAGKGKKPLEAAPMSIDLPPKPMHVRLAMCLYGVTSAKCSV